MTLTDIYVDDSSFLYIILFPHFWFPLKYVLMSWETFLIMSISTERWLAVCRPLWHRTHSLRSGTEMLGFHHNFSCIENHFHVAFFMSYVIDH